MIHKLRLVVLFFCVFALSGCVGTDTVYSVYIDSIGSAKETKKSYVLLPANKDVKPNDLQFKEYANYINRALKQNGFILAKDLTKASIAIFLGYGIGKPQKNQHTYSIPTYGQTGISSSNTYGSLTTHTPSYGITGSTTHTETYITYFRYMFLDASDLAEYRKSKKEIQLWKTKVTSTGSSGDLRLVFPVLVAASKDYIGTNTGKKILVEMSTEDPKISEIKGIEKEKGQKGSSQ